MTIDLYVNEVDASVVRRKWVPEIAKNIADEYDDGTTVEYDKVCNAVDEECERYVCYPNEGLTLILKYGWINAVDGSANYYDSPMFKFKRDVLDMTRRVLEGKDVEVID